MAGGEGRPTGHRPRELEIEPRHGGERDSRRKPCTWQRVNAQDLADGTIPVHPETKIYRIRGNAAKELREKWILTWPDIEMRIWAVPGGYTIINEHYESKSRHPEAWVALGKSGQKPYWDTAEESEEEVPQPSKMLVVARDTEGNMIGEPVPVELVPRLNADGETIMTNPHSVQIGFQDEVEAEPKEVEAVAWKQAESTTSGL